MQANAHGNLSLMLEWRDACNRKGIKLGPWMTRSGQEGIDFEFSAAEARRACLESGAQLFVAEGEIPAYSGGQPNPQAQNWPELVNELSDLPIPKAVGTSWSPFTDATGLPDATKAKALIEAGWHVLPYVYPAEQNGVTIWQQKQYARHYTHEAAPTVLAPGVGWYETEPVLGCYSGEFGAFTIDDFPGRKDFIGHSVWSGESVPL